MTTRVIMMLVPALVGLVGCAAGPTGTGVSPGAIADEDPCYTIECSAEGPDGCCCQIVCNGVRCCVMVDADGNCSIVACDDGAEPCCASGCGDS